MKSARILLRENRADLAIAATLSIGSFLLYLRTLAPTVLAADSGEFEFASYVLGIVHPTGYPLYLLLAKLFTYLPVGDIAYRVNLMSAFWAAVAVGTLYLSSLLIIRRVLPDGLRIAWGHNLIPHISAVTAAAAFAVSETFWSQAVIAEVYTLNAFFVALTLLLLVLWRSTPNDATCRKTSTTYPLALAFILGLSLSHHRSTLLLIPAYAVYLWLTRGPAWRKGLGALRFREVVLYAAAFALPLLLYLYIPLRAPESTYLKLDLADGRKLTLYSNDLPSFIDMVSGRVFGGKIEAGTGVTLEERGLYYLNLALRQFGPAGIGLGFLGALWTLGRRRDMFGLLSCTYLATVAFGLVYRIGDIYVFFIPAHMILAVFIGLGMCSLLSLARSPRLAIGAAAASPHARNPLRYCLAAALVALSSALIVSLLVSNYGRIDMSRSYGVRERWERILSETLEQGAILASDDRDDMVPLWYMQQVEKRRTDLIGLFPGIINSPAYADVVRLVESVGEANKPIYLIKAIDGLEVKYEIRPAGSLYEVIRGPSGYEAYKTVQADFGGKLRLLDYNWSHASPHSQKLPMVRAEDEVEVTIRWKVLAPMEKDYRTFIHVIDDRGQPVAQNDVTPGHVSYPTSRWVEGELLLDRHRLAMPPGLAPGFYDMRAGLYDAVSMANLATKQGEGSVVIGRLFVKPKGEIGPPPHPLQAVFDRSIRLLGYDLAAETAVAGADGGATRAGRPLKLTLYWESLVEVPTNYTVFVHVADLQGRIAAQSDSMPQLGKAPTSEWPAGETILDTRSIDLPGGLAQGYYRIVAGLYDLKTGLRLSLDTGEDSVLLSQIEIVQ